MRLLSRVPGRERWEIPSVRGHRGWADTIETILDSEDGVRLVMANPSTGRVLVEFDPARIAAPVEVLLKRALSFRPMTKKERAQVASPRGTRTAFAAAATTELGCLLFKAAFVGLCPWATFAMFSGAILFHRVIPDKTRRIRNDKDRAQVVKYRGDDRVYVPQSCEA
jgi:hypothetical protein